MSNEETQRENGPTDARLNPGGTSHGGISEDEEADSTLPPIRTPGSITKSQVCVCVCVYVRTYV